jgi:hypothetical protein
MQDFEPTSRRQQRLGSSAGYDEDNNEIFLRDFCEKVLPKGLTEKICAPASTTKR